MQVEIWRVSWDSRIHNKKLIVYLYGNKGVNMSNECDKYVNTRFKASDPNGVEYKNCQYEDTVDIEGSWSISDMFPNAHSIESVDGFSWK